MSEASPAQEPEVLEQLKNVKADGAELRNFTITFLSLLLYVNLIIASTDAEQILRVAPVNLPLLNVPLPIIGFYGFLPWLILLFHLYLLVQHYLFSQQLYRFNDKLAQAPDTIPAYVRKNLGNLPFLHWMVGQHGWMMQNVLTLITLVSLIFWPLATLLWLQMAILPYHSAVLLLWQRLALSMDVLLIAWLWPKTLDRQDSSRDWWKRGFALFIGWGRVWQARLEWAALKTALTQRWPDLRAFIHLFLLSAVLLPVVFLSWLVACLPDSPEDRWLASFPDPFSIPVNVDHEGTPMRKAFFLTASLHEQHAKPGLSKNEFNTLKAQGAKPCPRSAQANPSKEAEKQDCLMVQPWLPRNLILRGKVLTADPNLKPEVEAKFQAVTPKPEDFDLIHGLDLQNRNFDYADFTGSALPKADLRYASLKQAILVHSRLEHAHMQFIQAEKVNLSSATLTGTNLRSATLTGAGLVFATLADLAFATLTGADLSSANLTGADLRTATLTGADLSSANLTGADLSSANLTGADLRSATLTGADLRSATLTGAVLDDAWLMGANLSRATLTGADLRVATLTGAKFNYFKISSGKSSKSSYSELIGANLSGTTLIDADLSVATLTFIDRADIKVSAKALREALGYRSQYQGPENQKKLDQRIQQFEQDAKLPADFSKAKTMQPCLRKAERKAILPDCVTADAITAKDQQAFTAKWLSLACEGTPVANLMIERANGFTWLAQPLLEAAKDKNKCPGLAGLSDKDKDWLRKQAAKTPAAQ
jgi:uncharacterized protein YjbI with pentapeptide repeats